MEKNKKAERNATILNRNKMKRVLAVVMSILMIVSVIDYSAFQNVSAQTLSETKTITAFATLAEGIADQRIATGAEETTINTPNTLTVTVEVSLAKTIEIATGSAISADAEQTEIEQITPQEQTLTGITWQINGERSDYDTFDSANAGAVFIYEPVLPEGYILGDGVSLPRIQVQIDDMALSLLPMSALAADTTYDISVGALTINSGNLVTYDNATMTGTVSNEAEQLTIDGVTVNLTAEDLSIIMTGYGGNMSGITLKNNATLNLTVKGTNALTGAYGGAGIDVPQNCTLNITAESTGTLAVTGGNGYGGGAGIGAVGNQWSPTDNSTVQQSVGTIHIAGGTIIATGGSTYYYSTAYIGAAGIGGSPESTTGVISISGGTVTAIGGYSAAGIGGGSSGCVENIMIESGIVTATGGTEGSAIGSGYNGIASGTLSCGIIAINGGTVAVNGNIGYGGAYNSSNNVGGTVSIESNSGVTIKNGVISPSATGVTTYPLSITIYDGRLTGTIANASFVIGGTTYQSSINVYENYVGMLSCALVVANGNLTGTQTITVSGGGYSWADISCSEAADSYFAEIGVKLYPVSLWFYDSLITEDIPGATVSAQRSGEVLNADSAMGIMKLVCDGIIAKQENGIGKMTVWMTAGAEMEISVMASGLNDGSAMSKSGQTVNASADGTSIILNDTGETTQLSSPLDLSFGSITFAENGGKLNITYTPTNGGSAVTVIGQYYQNEYEIIQTNSGTTTTTNQIIFQNTTDFVKVKLNGVKMSSQGKAIDLQAAKAQLNLSGTNTIDCGGAAYNSANPYNSNLFHMGIHVAEGSALTIDGSGSLEVTNPSYYGVGIGGYYFNTFSSGKIREGAGVIRMQGGTLTVSSQMGAGIGSSSFYSGTNPGIIEISGGTLNAYSNTGAAIGGSGSAQCPAITISGGTVTANKIGVGTGGSGGSLVITGGTISSAEGEKTTTSLAVTNGSGESVYYTMANVSAIYGASVAVTNASVTGYDYGFNDVKTDNSGILHLYLPVSVESTKTTVDFDGITYDGTITSTEPNILRKYVQLAVLKGAVTDTGATLYVTANSGNTIYYAASGTALSEGSAVTGASGMQSVAASGGTETILLSDLTEGTAYTYYLTVKEGNDYSDVVSVAFTTLFTTTKTQPVFVSVPTITGTYGQQVKDMSVSQVASTNSVAGSWSISDSATAVPSVGASPAYDVIFTPEDAEQYGVVTVQVTPTVSPKSLTAQGVTIGEVPGTYVYDGTAKVPTVTVTDSTATMTASDYEYSYSNNTNAGTATATVTVTGEGNYTGTINRNFTIAKAPAPSITYPMASSITYGQQLSTSTLTGGSTQYGTFSWTSGNTVPTVTNSGYEVTFTPSAQTVQNYETITGTTANVGVTVNKATPAVTVNPTVSGNAGSRKATLTVTVTGVGNGGTPAGTVRFVNTTSGSDVDIPGATAVTITDGQGVFQWTGLADQIYKVKAVYSGDDNYNTATSEERELDTRKLNQSALYIGSIGTKTDGDSGFTLTTTGGSGTGAVTFTSSDPTIVSISGATATIHKAGSVTITAVKAEDSTYNEVMTSASLTIVNAPAPQGGSSNGDGTTTDTTQPDAGTPVIKDDSNKSGWEAIKEQIRQTKDGDIVTVEMNGSLAVPEEVLGSIRGTDMTLVFDMGDGITWSVNGQNITDNSLEDINLGITMDTDAIPENLINQVDQEQGHRSISLSHNGEFGFTAVLSINMEKKNAGLYVNMFYYNPSSKELELQSIRKINESGYVDFTFTHASDYVAAISTEPMYGKALDQITISATKGNLYVGGTRNKTMNLKLDLPELPEEIAESDSSQLVITYQSSNPKVATVTDTGKIVAKKSGNATITTLVTIGGVQKSFKTTIKVRKAYIKLIKSTNTLDKGDTFTFQAKGYGVNTEDIKFYTSKKSIVVINKTTGKAVAKSAGTDYVIAKVGKIEVRMKVEVK